MPKGNYRHGQRHTRLYKIWKGIKYRCDNPAATRFENYGGRGISYCTEWAEFVPFYEWALLHGYDDSVQIDRVDNNGDYAPENCRWVSASQNSRNRRSSRRETWQGETKTLADWTEDGRCVAPSELSKRLSRGWQFSEAMTRPKRRFKDKQGGE